MQLFNSFYINSWIYTISKVIINKIILGLTDKSSSNFL